MSDLQYSAYYRDAKLLTGKELKTLKASIKPSSSFLFVKLPAEVRHMIYREVAAESWCLYILLRHSEDRGTYWDAARIGDGLDFWSLVRSCKIIHREALGYLYERTQATLKTAATVEGRIPSVIPGMMERCELVFIHTESFDPRFEDVMECLHWGKHPDKFDISILHPQGPCSGIDHADALRKILDMW
ncbi:Disintegrin and metalloproteinase domain-containing protein B [Elsinoe australis]|uniref:Disintegrin and metalloproteinase domain-containing protein B n=1 Tax=Elsinoe australis TaxID=40998 RepID=A0A2P7Z0Q6_9PEZI|nr:Disintegrin and metalloproteinase domain-containing protein B [Elsinoe australis]